MTTRRLAAILARRCDRHSKLVGEDQAAVYTMLAR
jgi:hypothetical protein